MIEGAKLLAANLKLLSMKYKRCVIRVGYTAPYAIFVHENMEAQHPQGQAKFLEQPMRELRNDIRDLVAEELRDGAPLDETLRLAGDMLLKASQELVPVATGTLRDSGYVA